MITNTKKPSLFTHRSSIILFYLLLIPILASHLLLLADIPAGLFLDESSIGYNAVSILASGRDEHGVRLPVYFESVGDYKNPVFVYAAGFVLKIFGVSEFSLRFTSVLFYFSALALTLLLVNRIFDGDQIIWLYALLSFGFLPIFFTISRIAFEVIAQLTWVSAGTLLVWLIFHGGEPTSRGRLLRREDHPPRNDIFKPLACGLILGTSTYTYSTGRLLAFLGLAALWAVYSKRDNFKKLALITLAFAISLIPFFAFTLRSPGAITSRFYILSYLGEPIPFVEKISIFIQNYLAYFSPRFLLFQGDPNLRHSTGFGGVIFSAVFLLAMIGLAGIIFRKRWGKFIIYIVVSLLLSPVAAALTSEGTPHALRTMTLGYYIFLFSCFGISEFLSIENRKARYLSFAGITLLLSSEIVLYQLDYFLAYPARSVRAMGSKGFESSLQYAIGNSPEEIIFYSKPRETYADMQFYSLLVENPDHIPMTWDNRPKPAEDVCILYHVWNERELDQFPNPFEEFDSGGVIKARCYLS